MRLSGIPFSGLPDNELNSYQYVDAMRFLASKNDFITPLTSTAGVLVVSTKLGLVTENEHIICKSNVNFTAETQIKGSDGSTSNLTMIGSFKVNEYIRLIKTASGVTLIRLSDSNNIDLVVNELLFLKKANQTEENAGAIDTVATTPLTNLVAFIKRVNGTDSPTYLATDLQNGIYPKEHFSIVAGLGASPVRNIGTAAGIDIASGSIGTSYAVTGDIVSATLIDKPVDGSTIRIVLSNTMTDSNYLPKMYIESLSTIIGNDNNQGYPVFKIINSTTFDISIQSFQSTIQNLKIHFEVKKL